MWPSAKFVDDSVAFSRMPTEEELDEVAKNFDAVVVLVDDYELPYSLEEWEKRGVEVLHSPIPDFTAPSLEQLLEILRWVGSKTQEGKRVLIHCMGGLGRSGTVAVAWLMYSKGLPLGEALRRVRSLRYGAVETPEQFEVLRELEMYLSHRQF
ncbi:protein-tyrosine phosphatase family protein [Thermococcus waiotapuensis]|uniref:Dual specificity protein phosphatase family protein n=1 Tax=Thermococcus waiotapuensis TaxID=90909 RepID=A0AAE4T320_9EURY|nr:dual specificity protein phosphatase family protein [Thermococcus waiotapuensis]MDV3103388.1 dual specificity protein phosphatase family protein [Thermococcus waiotapuensis]